MDFIIVGLGGFLGSISRYYIYTLEERIQPQFPWATLFVNVIGCLIAGLLIGWTSKNLSEYRQVLLFSLIGFLGAFTTFSAFSVQTLQLIRANQVLLAVTNIIISVSLGLMSVWLGTRLTGS